MGSNVCLLAEGEAADGFDVGDCRPPRAVRGGEASTGKVSTGRSAQGYARLFHDVCANEVCGYTRQSAFGPFLLKRRLAKA